MRLWSRYARNWADAFPRIVTALKNLPADRVILDGEAVCLREDGRPDFHALRSKRACRDALLIAFDLLGLDNADLRPLPLSERRTRLAALLDGRPDALWLSSHVEGADGPALLRHACAMNLEGIVSKRTRSRYHSGPFDGWRKILCPGYTRP